MLGASEACEEAWLAGTRTGKAVHVLYVEDLKEVLRTNLTTTMLRDQGGGPNRILLEFTFEFTKDFLGAKDVYVKPLIAIPSTILETLLTI
jgi:hypothetical protein